MKYLGYILTGVISAAAAATGSYFVTRHVTTKKLRDKYEQSTAEQLNQCREYYKTRIRRLGADARTCIMAETEKVMTEADVKSEVEEAKSEKDLVITDPSVKQEPRLTESESNNPYHKMYGATEGEAPEAPVITDVGDDPSIYARERPYLITRSQFYDEYTDYKKVSLMYFIGDVKRNESGDITYVPVLYSEGRTDISVIGPDDQEFEERCIKLDEIDNLIGSEWKSHFSDVDFGYDNNEVLVANDKLKTCFSILRDERMYKVVIAGLDAGDEFDYSEVR